MARDWEQVTGQLPLDGKTELSPRQRRLLRHGPRIRPPRHRSAASPPAASSPDPGTQVPRPVIEWHDMTPGEETATWAELRAWVTWLYDRYELSVEDRLPRCWARHPGLVEELYALKAWRQEIYSGTQPSGQAARYWHAELRQVLHAAATQYALGCRTGHRGNVRLAAEDPALLQEWAAAYPLAGAPGIDLAAGIARHAGTIASTAEIASALDDGTAVPAPGIRDTLYCQGRWLAPAASGWTEIPPPERGLPAPAGLPLPRLPGAATDSEREHPDPWTKT
jgi:hypothetical protein